MCGGGKAVTVVTLATLKARIIDSKCGIVVAEAQDYGAETKGDVVLTSETGSRVTSANGWTYIASGKITSVTPGAGAASTKIVIKGEGLLGGGKSVGSVTLAGVAAFVDKDTATDTEISVVAFAPAANTPQPGDVVITGNTGVVVRKVKGWLYSRIDAVTPPSGQRGTVVDIKGVALFAGGSKVAGVSLGGVPVLKIINQSATHVQVVARGHSVDLTTPGEVVLTADNGQKITLKDAFSYTVAGAINKVTPIKGQQGTYVTITGVDLFGGGTKAVSVELAGTTASKIIDGATKTRIEVVASLSKATAGDIVITADTGATVVLQDGTAKNVLPDGKWTYLPPAVIKSVDPPIGQRDSIVTISGEHLLGGGEKITAVSLSTIDVKKIVSSTDSKIVVVAKDAPSYNLCSAVCHANCATCVDGPWTRLRTECATCLPNFDQAGTSCDSVCGKDKYRQFDTPPRTQSCHRAPLPFVAPLLRPGIPPLPRPDSHLA